MAAFLATFLTAFLAAFLTPFFARSLSIACYVRHVSCLLKPLDLGSKGLLHFRWQRQHPVEHTQQLPNLLSFQSSIIEPLDQSEFPLPASRRRMPGLEDLELRQYNRCERVGRLLEGRLIPAVIDQLDHREPNADLAAPVIVPKVVRTPARLLVAQDRQADHLAVVPVENPVVVHVHALRECLFSLPLHFDMNEQPSLVPSLRQTLNSLSASRFLTRASRTICWSSLSRLS